MNDSYQQCEYFPKKQVGLDNEKDMRKSDEQLATELSKSTVDPVQENQVKLIEEQSGEEELRNRVGFPNEHQNAEDRPNNKFQLFELPAKQIDKPDAKVLSIDEKVAHLKGLFKSIPPLMIRNVLRRDDVKEDLDVAVICLKGMFTEEAFNIARPQEEPRSGAPAEKTKGETQKTTRETEQKLENDFGYDNESEDHNLCEPNDSSEIEDPNNSENEFYDANDSWLVIDEEKYKSELGLSEKPTLVKENAKSKQINKPAAANVLSIDEKVAHLKDLFKSIPLLMIRKVLQRDDVKEDLDVAVICLKGIFTEDASSIARPQGGSGSGASAEKTKGEAEKATRETEQNLGNDFGYDNPNDSELEFYDASDSFLVIDEEKYKSALSLHEKSTLVKEKVKSIHAMSKARRALEPARTRFLKAKCISFADENSSGDIQSLNNDLSERESGKGTSWKIEAKKSDVGKVNLSEEHKSSELEDSNDYKEPDNTQVPDDLNSRTSDSGILAEQSGMLQQAVSLEDKIKHLRENLRENFSATSMMRNVFQRDDVKGDPHAARSCLKAMSSCNGETFEMVKKHDKRIPSESSEGEKGGATLEIKQKFPDFENAQKSLESRTLEGAEIKVERASANSDISVPDLSANTTLDRIEHYFPNLTRTSGEFASVPLEEGNSSSQAVITLKDLDKKQKTLHSKCLKLNEAKLTEETFNPTFHDRHRGYNAEIAVAVEKDVMEFISTTNCLNELKETLSGLGFDMNYTAGDTIVYITSRTTAEDSANKQGGIQAVTDFTKKFKTIELDVDTNHWDAVTSEISKLQNEIGKNKLLLKEASFSKDKVTIICRNCDQEGLKGTFSAKIAEIQTLEVKKYYGKHEMLVEEEKLALLKKIGFREKYLSEYSELEAEIDQDSGTITMIGPKKQCSEAKHEIYKHLSKISERKIPLSQTVFEMLSTDEGLERIKAELMKKQLETVFCINENNEETAASVVGINKKHADDAAELIKSITTEIKVKVDKDMMEVLRTQKWSDLCDEVKSYFKVYVRRNEFFDTWIAGFKEDVSSAQKRIQKFLDDNSVKSITFRCFDTGVRRFILEYRKEDLLKMENDYSVKIKPDEAADTFLISGTKKGVARVQEYLDILTVSIAMNEIKAQQPGLHKFFTSGRGDRLVNSVEHKHQCVIEKVVESLVPVFSTEADRTAPLSSSTSKSADSKSMTCGNLRISWKQGNIVTEQVDVLVGSTTGQLSKVFQTVGGPPIQQTFKQVQVRSGTVTVTDSGYLPCKHVIFTSCCEWDSGKGAAERELRSIVQRCLLSASKLNATSIAFPVIGTGELGFPNDVACQIMISEVISVIKGWETPCLDDIRFIVYAQDAQLIKAFQKEFALASSQLSAHAHKGEGFVSPTKQEYLLSSRSPDTITTTAFGNVSVKVLLGDLVQETTDAIVNINSIGMDMQKAGALSKAVSAAAGPSVQTECNRLGKQTPGSAVVTGAGNLNVRYVIHVIPGKADVEHIQSCIEECLHTADVYAFQSISMPAFGTGAYGMSAADSGNCTFQALAKVCPTLRHVREIRIVIFQANLISAFQQKKRQYETGTATEMKSPKLPKQDKMVKSRRKQDIYLMETISFCFFGKSKDSFNKAKAELAEGLKEACSTQTIQNKDISKLSEQQRQKLRTKASHTGVIITFLDGTSQRIEIQGDPEDVSVMVNYVWEEIYSKNEVELTERQNENAEVIYETVKWRFDVDGKRVGFGKKVNADIEKARVRKDHQVTVEVEGKKCVTNFATSTGTELSSGRTFRVTRATVKGDIEDDVTLPKEWVPMPTDSSGKEEAIHLVTLTNSSAEYKKVLNLFQSTGGTGYIVKIQRIQNPHLYQQYMVRKQKMDKDNPGMNNERQLFHGTPAKNLKDINARGFNRSFCGANNTRFGDGVYFATDASYSETFTRPNAKGKRHMYIARVLIGRYTKGQKGMKVPPKVPNRPGMSFDSVANHYYRDSQKASIFVVFYDSQCYPEYLITFQECS